MCWRGIMCYRKPVSYRLLLLLELAICVLTFELLDKASLFGFVLCVALTQASGGMKVTDHVRLISFLRFVLSKTILRLLTVEIYCRTVLLCLDPWLAKLYFKKFSSREK